MSFLKQHFPQVAESFIVRVSDEGRLSVEMPVNDKHLRQVARYLAHPCSHWLMLLFIWQFCRK